MHKVWTPVAAVLKYHADEAVKAGTYILAMIQAYQNLCELMSNVVQI